MKSEKLASAMKKRIVIKVGSNVLTRPEGKLDVTRMSAIVDQIAWLRRQGYDVILVSSGAVSAGRDELRTGRELDSVEQRQLFSALGQVKLMGLYYDLFREYDIHIGQVLTMKKNFEPGDEYASATVHECHAGEWCAAHRQRERHRQHHGTDVYR